MQIAGRVAAWELPHWVLFDGGEGVSDPPPRHPDGSFVWSSVDSVTVSDVDGFH
ncbi:hypothetical protein [Candidatus Poriferisodalis sp.]|uniref:hypothetical protein n=1 Tax=Candidatus Poriferisodalis sp. TaxID=3101277 RepID=UPI003B0107BF